MRVFRNILSVLLVAALGFGTASMLTTASAGAASSEPQRVITEESPNEHRVGFNAFKLKGVVTQAVLDPVTGQPAIDPTTGLETYVPYAKQKVKLQKKKCKTKKRKNGKKFKKCRWKTVKKLKTNDSGKFKTRIFAPRKGKWKWRVNVKASDGYRTTKGKRWTAAFR